ncbi:MAG: CDP-diacylglycerol--glycerol-3-phosphate 3-phosphatidyltransferase [Alphaproteobacteria bacterium]|jgi:CDP-diacylglycerol--glycerol-3-phosphate 3-phosphatidyltransferase/cardiolipin synthase|nr:CDP-diacylglycerol--glycerol-3-phosphate 3-phosphatidyltransferase [Alphaproteobacteria bacterium]
MGDHLPNLLTFARIALTPVFVAAFWWPAEMGGRWVVLALFLIAAITDYADGWIARRRNMESRLGAMLDPIADKLLIASALVMLVYKDDIRGFVIIPALVILAREILVSGMREFLATIAIQVPVSSISKFKTVVQVIAIAMLIVAPAIEHVWGWLHQAGIVALWGAAVLTLYTGFSYVQANVAHVSGEHARPRPREAGRTS